MLSAINEEFSFAYGPPDTVPRYTLYPTTADVLATHVNAAECAMSCTQVPDNAMVVSGVARVADHADSAGYISLFEFEAFLVEKFNSVAAQRS